MNDQPIKRKRTESTNCNSEKVPWSIKRFQNKSELDKFISSNDYIYRSKEENTELQTCRFCQAINPNIEKHMIQVYLKCSKCKNSGKTKLCCKTNICSKLNKYELLTNHKDISKHEWITFEKGQPINDEDLAKNLSNMTIGSKVRKDYFKLGNFYVWVVKDVLPFQTYLFEELYMIKMDNKWIEFYNGVERNTYTHIVDIPDGMILRREDDLIFQLDSKQLLCCENKETLYKGGWVQDKNKQIPCITCSNEIEKMVFECDHLPIDMDTIQVDGLRVWKAKSQYCLKYFIRINTNNWEEYCNDELINKFNFIGFDENNDLIIRRKSDENPDFLRFTDREVFIGSVKHFIYGPLYTGYWENEKDFRMNTLKSPTNDSFSYDSLDCNHILEYLNLVRKYLKINNKKINGLEDPNFLKNQDFDKISKFKEFVRIINLSENYWVCCAGSIPSNFELKPDVFIFDSQPEYHENLNAQIIKWFERRPDENIFFCNVLTKKQAENLSSFFSLAWLTEYVINFDPLIKNLAYFQRISFDETKFVDHFNACLEKEQISRFPCEEDIAYDI